MLLIPLLSAKTAPIKKFLTFLYFNFICSFAICAIYCLSSITEQLGLHREQRSMSHYTLYTDADYLYNVILQTYWRYSMTFSMFSFLFSLHKLGFLYRWMIDRLVIYTEESYTIRLWDHMFSEGLRTLFSALLSCGCCDVLFCRWDDGHRG